MLRSARSVASLTPITCTSSSAGRFELVGLRPAPRGVPKLEVTFTLDERGQLGIQALETLNGQVQALTVRYHYDMPSKFWEPLRVAAIVLDADLHRVEDEQLNARVVAKSRFEQYIYGLRTSLDHFAWSSVLTPNERAVIERIHDENIVWLRENENASVQQLDAKLGQVQVIAQPIVQNMSARQTYSRVCSLMTSDG